MCWWTTEKAFLLEAYFANNSYKVVQANFRRKFLCRHALLKSRICGWIQTFRVFGTVQNQTIDELKAAITAKISEIPKEEYVRVIDNFAWRTYCEAVSQIHNMD